MTPRSVRLLVVSSVAGVFLGGLAVGYAVATYRAERPAQVEGPRPGRPGPTPEQHVDLLLATFAERLELSPDQRTTLRAILLDGDAAARAIVAEVRPRLEAQRAVIEAAIAAVLTPAQRARYAEIGDHGLTAPNRPPGGPPPHGPPPPPDDPSGPPGGGPPR